jgi:hypothetical protein
VTPLRLDPAHGLHRPFAPRLRPPPVPQLTHAQTRLLMLLARRPRLWTDCDVFDARGLVAAGVVEHDRVTDLVSITPAGRRLLEAAP